MYILAIFNTFSKELKNWLHNSILLILCGNHYQQIVRQTWTMILSTWIKMCTSWLSMWRL